MICEKCSGTEFVNIDLPDNQNTVVIISEGKEIKREDANQTPHRISVCKLCGSTSFKD